MRRIIIIYIIGWAGLAGAPEKAEALMDRGRQLFYAGVSDKRQLAPAIETFRELMRRRPDLEGRALTYIGALEALKGKHAFLPHDKYRKTLHGLDLMDQGLAKSPQDVEALFVHGSTCYFLPFFFNRSQDAGQHFKTILQLLPEEYHRYDAEIVRNVMNFIEEKVEITSEEQVMLLKIRSALNGDESS